MSDLEHIGGTIRQVLDNALEVQERRHHLGVLPPPDATHPRPWPPMVIAKLSEAYAEIQVHNPYDDPCLVRALGLIGALREAFISIDEAELESTPEGIYQRWKAGQRDGAA